jgi:hypothetical protein
VKYHQVTLTDKCKSRGWSLTLKRIEEGDGDPDMAANDGTIREPSCEIRVHGKVREKLMYITANDDNNIICEFSCEVRVHGKVREP